MPPEADTSWVEGCPARLKPALLACAKGELPPNVALMRLLMMAEAETEAETALGSALGRLEGQEGDGVASRRLREALRLLHAHRQAFATVKAVLAEADHTAETSDPEEGLACWAAAFDRAARASPEGAVALYALGDPGLLRAASAEVVERMRAWGLLGRGRAVLEIGCGIGRLVEALGPEVGAIVGIDISTEMIAAAEKRCRGLPDARLLHVDGRDLSAFADASFDLVLAADSFPYLVRVGMALAERHITEVARVLRPGGDGLILNFSYRGDLDRDRADVARLAAQAGLVVMRDGTRDFALWDAAAFHLRRPADGQPPGTNEPNALRQKMSGSPGR
jgi:SAM-dependent methyltransferase